MKKIVSVLLLTLCIGFGFASNSDAAAAFELTNLIPVMTSNSSPSGEAFSSSNQDGEAYNLFDRINVGYNYDWATKEKLPVYVGYDFKENKVVTRYTITPTAKEMYVNGIPKDWIFQAWDGSEWVDLDKQQNQTNWKLNEVREYSIDNEKGYTKYRLYIIADNGRTGGYTCIGEMEMFGREETKPVDPVPDPVPTSDRAILTIILTTGLEKEFDLSMEEVNAFFDWYDTKENGYGPAKYGIDKHTNNKGPFSKRVDYVIFKNILSFEVDEYTLSK